MTSGLNFRHIILSGGLLLTLSSGPAFADWEPIIGAKLQELFAYKTHTWMEGGKEHNAHYEPRGDLMLVVDGELAPSFWRIISGTSACIEDRANKELKCYEFQIDGDAYRMLPKDSESGDIELQIVDGIKTF